MKTAAISRPDIPHLGFALGLFAAVCLSSQDALIKWITEAVHVSQVVVVRGAAGVLLAAGWAAMTGAPAKELGTQKPLLVALRAVSHAASWLCYYTALTMLPLAIYTSLGFMVYVFAAALSGIFLGERTDKLGWFAVAAGLVGAVIIVNPGGDAAAINYRAAGLLLFGSLMWACSILVTRALGPAASAAAVMFYTHIALTVAGAGWAFFNWQSLPPAVWGLIAAAAAVGSIGHLSAIAAYRATRVAVVIPTQYTTLLWASLLGWFFWSEPVTAQLVIGAVIIMLSGVAALYKKNRR